MVENFGIFEAIDRVLLPYRSEFNFEAGDEEEAELLQLTENDLDRIII